MRVKGREEMEKSVESAIERRKERRKILRGENGEEVKEERNG